MKKKRVNKILIIFLFMMEIAVGVAISRHFLIDAIAKKRILHPIKYSVIVNNIEADSLTDTNSDVYNKNMDTIDLEGQAERSQDDTSITLSVTHDLNSVKGEKIAIVNAEESSVINQEGYENTAYQAYDGALSTSWQEGVDGPGLGSWLYYKFDGMHYINDIVIYAGIWREAEGKDYYHDNYRPKEIQITISGLKWNVSFDDDKQPQVIHFSNPMLAEEMTITILEAYEGNKYEDLGIAEIVVYE